MRSINNMLLIGSFESYSAKLSISIPVAGSSRKFVDLPFCTSNGVSPNQTLIVNVDGLLVGGMNHRHL